MAMSEQQIQVLIEDFKQHVKILADGHLMLSERMDRMENNLGGKIDRLEFRMDRMEGRMDRMEGRMDQMEGRMDRMDGKIDIIGKDLESVKLKVNAIDEKLEKHILQPTH